MGPEGGRFAGKIVLVTGGAGGIGRASAERFVIEGADHVVLADLDGDGAARVADELAAASERTGAVRGVAVDVSDEASVRDLVDGIVADHGRIDVGFNNAGMTDSPGSFHDLELDRWNRVIAVNLTSVFVCMKHELRHMVAVGSGSIVNTSSVAGLVAAPFLPHYTASKHGIIGLTRAAASEYRNKGIRVNTVLPGTTESAMTRRFIEENPAMADVLKKTSVTGDFLDPDEIADAVVWLASDDSRRVNGQSVVVDGGGFLH